MLAKMFCLDPTGDLKPRKLFECYIYQLPHSLLFYNVWNVPSRATILQEFTF